MSRFWAFTNYALLGLGTVAILTAAYRLTVATTHPERLGIYPSDDGNAVYLAGEACTVNWTPSPVEMHGRLQWCWNQYNQEQHGELR